MKTISIRLPLVVAIFIVFISFVHDVDSRTADDVEFNESIGSANGTIYIPYVAVPSVIFNGDFERGPVGWGQYSANGWPLILDTSVLPVSPHSGFSAVWMGGDYDEEAALWQVVKMPAGGPRLKFWLWIASEDVCGYDVAGVAINLDEVVDAFWLCSDNNTGGWIERTVDLSGYAGQTIELDFVAFTDDILNSNLFIDDVSIGKVVVVTDLGGELGDTEFDISALRLKEAENQKSINRQGTTSKDYRLDSILQEMQKMLSGPGGK